MLIWILLTLLAAIVVIVTVGPIRRFLLTTLILRWYKSVLPPMSSTEREAIDAGDTWFEAELFQGRPKWQKFLSNPMPMLRSDEQAFIEKEVTTFCNMLDDWQITHKDYDLPPKAWEYLKSAGFFGMHIPKEYGGLEFSTLASSTVIQKVATKSSTAAVIVMVPNSLGPGELLLNYGTDEQKTQYLNKLAKGIEVPCFGLTSPVAGSDAGSIIDEAVVTEGEFNGQQVLGLRLNWNKRYITLAPVATVIGLAVKVKDPQHLLGNKLELGITVVLMPTDLPGIEIGKRHFPLNNPFMNGPTRGVDVFVPLDFVIGGRDKIGHGWQMLVECLAAGRGISLPAVSTATGKHCFTTTGAYAKLRQQFGLSIGKFEGVAAALARIGGFTYMLEATRILTLGAIDSGAKPSVVTAICKYHMTEMARTIINDAMDVHGGRGIMLGPRNYLARIYESVPVGITVEGANILTRSLIIFGQGAIRCHPYILKEMYAAMEQEQTKALKDFDAAFFGHLIYTCTNFCKLIFHAATFLIFCAKPKNSGICAKYYRILSFLSLALACTSDVAMLSLGGALKRKENLSARLGDVLSYLYIGSAVLKYFKDCGTPKGDEPFVNWALQYCTAQIQMSFVGFFVNFPNQIFAKPLQWLIFPFWRNFRVAADKVDLEMSQAMMHASELRTRFSQNCIAVAKLEEVWSQMLSIEPLLTNIARAVKDGQIPKSSNSADRISIALSQKIISQSEAQTLNDFATKLNDIIQVDEFTQHELTGK